MQIAEAGTVDKQTHVYHESTFLFRSARPEAWEEPFLVRCFKVTGQLGDINDELKKRAFPSLLIAIFSIQD